MKGKPKSSVWKYYDATEDKVAFCKFCKNTSFKNNSTRMAIHLSKCKRCPPSIQRIFLENSSGTKTALLTEEGRSRDKQLKLVHENDENDFGQKHQFQYPSFVDRMSQEEQVSHKIFAGLEVRTKAKGVLIIVRNHCRNEGITNVLVGTPTPFFVESIESKEQSQDHLYYVDCASKTIEKFGATKFVGVVTDNAAVMKKCRKSLQQKYKFLIEYPCAMHGIQLLIGFVIKLPTAQAISNSAKQIVKTIKRSHKLCASFARIQEDKKIRTSLQLPGKTRFGSNVTLFQSMLNSKVALQCLAVDPAVADVLSNEHRDLLLDNVKFWADIQSLYDLTLPLKNWITILESDEPRFHLVVEAFDEIRKNFNERLTDSILTNEEIFQLEDKLMEIYNECVTDAHLAANYLHPTIQGKNLTTGQIEKVMEFLEVYAERLDMEDVEDVSLEAIQFKTHSGPFEAKYLWTCSSKVDAITWWSKVAPEIKIQKISLNLLQLSATSAPTERSFSTHAKVHSKPRNRTKTARAAKLTYVAFNLKTSLRNSKRKKNKNYVVVDPKQTESEVEIIYDHSNEYSDQEYQDSDEDIDESSDEDAYDVYTK